MNTYSTTLNNILEWYGPYKRLKGSNDPWVADYEGHRELLGIDWSVATEVGDTILKVP